MRRERQFNKWYRENVQIYTSKIGALFTLTQLIWHAAFDAPFFNDPLRSQNEKPGPIFTIFSMIVLFFAFLIPSIPKRLLDRVASPSFQEFVVDDLYKSIVLVQLASIVHLISARLFQCANQIGPWSDDTSCIIMGWANSGATRVPAADDELFVAMLAGDVNASDTFINRYVKPQVFSHYLLLQSMLPFLLMCMFPLVGLSTFDAGFYCCCEAKQRRCGYRFLASIVVIPIVGSVGSSLSLSIVDWLALMFQPMMQAAGFGVLLAFLTIINKLIWSAFFRLNLQQKKHNVQQKCLTRNHIEISKSLAMVDDEVWRQIDEKLALITENLEDVLKQEHFRTNTSGFSPTANKLRELHALGRTLAQLSHKGKRMNSLSRHIHQASVMNLSPDTRKPEIECVDIRKLLSELPNVYPESTYRMHVHVNSDVPRIISIEIHVFLNCIMNYLENAIKYTTGKIHISASISNNVLLFEVSDHGEGIDPEDQTSLFTNPNLTLEDLANELRRSSSGNRASLTVSEADRSGFGLWSVKRLLGWLDQTCGVKSPCRTRAEESCGALKIKGYGSCFWFTLANEGVAENMRAGSPSLDNAGLSQSSDLPISTRNIEIDQKRLSIWDPTVLTSILGGQEACAIRTFQEELDNTMAILISSKADKQEVLRHAHKVKTSARIVGACRLEDMCKHIERERGNIEMDAFKEEVRLLYQEFHRCGFEHIGVDKTSRIDGVKTKTPLTTLLSSTN